MQSRESIWDATAITEVRDGALELLEKENGETWVMDWRRGGGGGGHFEDVCFTFSAMDHMLLPEVGMCRRPHVG